MRACGTGRLTAAGAVAAIARLAMTVGELRAAARHARVAHGSGGRARAAAYEVEIQKKLALAAACLFLALAGAATGIRFPRGGAKAVLGTSVIVFGGFWLSLMAGESLADRQNDLALRRHVGGERAPVRHRVVRRPTPGSARAWRGGAGDRRVTWASGPPAFDVPRTPPPSVGPEGVVGSCAETALGKV